MQERNLSVELLKFIAVISVVNSHFDPIYGDYTYLSTGGAIGDVLFFFVSGFTIFLGRFGRFDNWYKRRIKRIYPSIIAWAMFLSIMGIEQLNMNKIVYGGGFWFVSCIMLYYVVLYLVRKFAVDKPLIPFAISIFAIIVWYQFEDKSCLFMYGDTYFKWLHYFIFMLTGAYIGNKTITIKVKPKLDSLFLIISLVVFYGIQLLANRFIFFLELQLFSLLPLMGVVVFLYKLCCLESINTYMRSKKGFFPRFVAGLCLEAYIVQYYVINNIAISDFLMPLFPFNLLITFLLILFVAYLIRCLARIVSQVFEKEDFDWKKIYEPVSK